MDNQEQDNLKTLSKPASQQLDEQVKWNSTPVTGSKVPNDKTKKRRSKKKKLDVNNVISIIDAKNEWESSVDALDKLAIIVLDEDLKITRANKTIELWGWGDVNAIEGKHISDIVDPVISEDSRYHFYRTWVELDGKSSCEWESTVNATGNVLRFTFYPAKDAHKKSRSQDTCFYVLVVDDLSKRKNAEKNLKQYVSKLEFERLVNSQRLEYVNTQLESKLKKEQISKKQLKQSEKQLQILSQQLIDAQEDERKRVACELHDGIGQILGAIKYQIEGMLLSQGSADNIKIEDYQHGFDEVINNITSAMQEVKRVSMNLRPTMLDEIGVIKTLDWLFEEFKKVYKYEVNFDCNILEDDIEDIVKVVIFRIVQESMNNIAKHANASRITVSLKIMKNGIMLRIMDDGDGFWDCEKDKEKQYGLGLKSMKERAESSGARFSIKSEVGEGTIVQVVWGNIVNIC